MMGIEKIVLVTRKTRLEELVERFNTRPQARFYIEHNGGDFGLYEREHDVYYAAISRLRRELRLLARFQEVERVFLPNFLFSETDLVVTVGIDGLVVNTAKYLSGQPLVAVNPDPEHIDGVLLPFQVGQAAGVVQRVMEGTMPTRPVSMAAACLNTGETLLGFNDLFVGVDNHVSARYTIRHAGRQEAHSSSGVIISTGVGSTGWLSSLFNMAEGILAAFGPEPGALDRPAVGWEADQLVFVVREPFRSKTSAADIVCGVVEEGRELVLESHIPAGGVIFSDGILDDFLPFNAGTIATICLADRKAALVVEST